jgi:hypothetical protein
MAYDCKTVGVVGTRERDTQEDFDVVWNEWKKWYDPGDSICSGLCKKGGDRFAVIIADRLGLPKDKIIWHKAIWRRNGKYIPYAGFERNTDIAKDSDVLIACVRPDRNGGTEDTIRKWIKFHPDTLEKLIIV